MGASALASAAVTAAHAASVPTSISGAFSSTIASCLHVAIQTGLGVSLGLSAAIESGGGASRIARAQAGADGVAELRVPYATRTDAPARPTGPWRVRAGGASWRVPVSEDDLMRGAMIAVEEAGSRVGVLESNAAGVALR